MPIGSAGPPELYRFHILPELLSMTQLLLGVDRLQIVTYAPAPSLTMVASLTTICPATPPTAIVYTTSLAALPLTRVVSAARNVTNPAPASLIVLGATKLIPLLA